MINGRSDVHLNAPIFSDYPLVGAVFFSQSMRITQQIVTLRTCESFSDIFNSIRLIIPNDQIGGVGRGEDSFQDRYVRIQRRAGQFEFPVMAGLLFNDL